MDALAVPVTVISQEQMQESGVETNILDILRKVSPAITGIGGENATITSGANLGGSGGQHIHNLSTLVLIDGHREAYDPVDAGGGLEFVDLNQLPLAAIDHIEVLSDGASAIYGADAVGGVINIILRKDFNGSQMDAHYGFSDTTGHYSERSGDLVAGVSNGTTSLTVSVSYTQTDPIFESERPYSNPYYGTTYFPGIIEDYNFAGVETTGVGDEFYQLAPGLNAPPGGGTYTIQQLVGMGVYKDLGDASTPGVLNSVEQKFNLAADQNFDSVVQARRTFRGCVPQDFRGQLGRVRRFDLHTHVHGDVPECAAAVPLRFHAVGQFRRVLRRGHAPAAGHPIHSLRRCVQSVQRDGARRRI